MEQTTTEPLPHKPLQALLQRMLVDIQDPQCYYWVYTDYFEVQPPTDRTATRFRLTPLSFTFDALRNPRFTHDGLLCDIILKNKLPEEWETVKLGFE